MDDVNCPYCNAPQETNHDDGYGYEEDKKHEQQCGNCDKYFTFTTSIHFSYEAEKAPCLNEGEHDMRPVTHYPRCYPEWKRCIFCEHEVRGRFVSIVPL